MSEKRIMKMHAYVLAAVCFVGGSEVLAAQVDSFNGEWKGEMSCGATADGKSEPFTHPVSMIVFGDTVRLTRETPRVVENLGGLMSPSGHLEVSGPGQFKSGQGQSWNTRVSGQATGARFEGVGGIYAQDGTKRRDCRLMLSLTAVSQAAGHTPMRQSVADVKVVANNQRQTAPSTSQSGGNVNQTGAAEAVTKQSSGNDSAVNARGAARATKPAASKSSEKTVTGVVQSGTLDSALEVASGRTYVFMTKSSIAEKIFSKCKLGDTCSVTGRFDDEAENILTVTRAVKVK
ncbi:hypothetical protein CupriaWKF_12515 [Cupriavidus sp. WKF15]|uniref:hypothetical protein n=1 Tax=Cupriavidus sp. WKF15 TaxID=3032282 RepID=UPI0023E2A5B2|nr:hypothetical protein [Cupriavidus sp. WKF15]WER45130.1 hypothetical protein CupriaWKF_12515 [Cupriavidus sp. WKF15]